MNRKFSPKVKKIISLSRDEAVRLGHDYIGTEHLLLGMIREKDNVAIRVLNSLDLDIQQLKYKVEEATRTNKGDNKGLSCWKYPAQQACRKGLEGDILRV